MPQPQQESLVNWLRMSEFDTLVKVLESSIMTLQAAAANTMLEAAITGNEQPHVRVKNDMAEAADIAKTVTLLQKLRISKDLFRVIIATPSKKP